MKEDIGDSRLSQDLIDSVRNFISEGRIVPFVEQKEIRPPGRLEKLSLE